jgi:hypothetical protein
VPTSSADYGWLLSARSILPATVLRSVDIRFFHQLQKLACIGRERFDVAPLSFRVQRVERSEDLPEPDKPVIDHEAVAREVEIYIFEIVRARTADAYDFAGAGVIMARALQRHDFEDEGDAEAKA